MNKTLMVVLVVVLVLLGGGLLYSMTRGTEAPNNATSTPPVVQNNNTTVTTSEEATAPTVVTSTTTFTSDNTAMVIGTVNPKGAFTSYWYEYGITSNLGNKTVNQTLGSGFIGIQAPGYITNLTKNTTYYFRLVAENQFGKVVGNQFTFKTTQGSPAPLGSAPTTKTISATGISRTTANLNGEVTANKTETQYWFEYGKTTELGNISTFSSAGQGSSKTSVSISLSNLLPQTTYYFRINAQNQFGTVNGSILNFKTTGPSSAKEPSVTTGNATDVKTTFATLHGTVTPNLAETSYWFEYSTSSLLGGVLLQTTERVSVGAGESVIAIDKDVSNLKPKTTYYFRIVAQNSKGTVRGDKSTFKTN